MELPFQQFAIYSIIPYKSSLSLSIWNILSQISRATQHQKKMKNSLTNELHYLVFSDGQTDVMHLNCFHNHFISDAVISGTLYLFSSSTLENHMRVMGMEGDNKNFIFKPLITIILEFWDEAITSKAFKINF